jgi:predicted DNA binding protein
MPAIVEFAIPAEEFALQETLERRPDLKFEASRVVAYDTARVMPFVWVWGEELEGLTSILEADPSVETVELLSEGNRGRFYRLEWADEARILGYMVIEHNAAIQRAVAANDQWTLRVLFPGRSSVSATDDFAREHGFSLALERLSTLDDQYHRVQFDLTECQHKTLVESYEQGYYNIPREMNAPELADKLDISHQALSERLRRGMTRLIKNTLMINEDEAQSTSE